MTDKIHYEIEFQLEVMLSFKPSNKADKVIHFVNLTFYS